MWVYAHILVRKITPFNGKRIKTNKNSTNTNLIL